MSDATAVQLFTMPPSVGDYSLRAVIIDDEPWFVARDVCEALDVTNVSQALNRLDDDEYQQVSPTIISNEVRPGAGPQSVTVVSEPGLYGLILGSRKPEAKVFKRWVKHDVVPQIRKTGAYVPAPKAMDPLDALQVMIDQMRVQRDRLAVHDRAILELGARTERLEAGYERLAATGFANLRGLRHDVAYLNRLGRVAGAIARRRGVIPEKAHSTIFGTVNAWPVEIWDEALNQIAATNND